MMLKNWEALYLNTFNNTFYLVFKCNPIFLFFSGNSKWCSWPRWLDWWCECLLIQEVFTECPLVPGHKEKIRQGRKAEMMTWKGRSWTWETHTSALQVRLCYKLRRLLLGPPELRNTPWMLPGARLHSVVVESVSCLPFGTGMIT